MGGILSPFISASVNHFVSRLIDMGVGADLAAEMGVSLSHNNMKVFESLSSKVMADKELSMSTKTSFTELLKVTLDADEFTMVKMISEPWIPAATFILMLSMIFKSGIPMFMLMLACTVFVGASITAMVFRQFLEVLPKVRARLCSSTSLMPALVSMQTVETDQTGQYVSTLVAKAGCSSAVDKQVVAKATSMHAIASLYVAKESCRNINSVSQGRLNGRTGTMGFPARPVDDFKKELKSAEKTIDELDGVIEERIQGLKTIAKIARSMDDALDEVESTLKSYENTSLKYALTSAGKDKQERQRERVLEAVQPALKTLAKHSKSLQIEQSGIDAKQVREKCKAMVEIIGINASSDQATANALQEAVEARNKVSEIYANAAGEVARLQVEVDRKTSYKHDKQLQFNAEITALDLKVSGAKALITEDGSIHMRGSANDEQSREIERMWNQGRFSDLRKRGGYKSSCWTGTFEFWVDPNPTQKQKECQAHYDELCAEADKRKLAHQNDMIALEGEIGTLIEKMKDYQFRADAAKKDMDKTMSEDEPCMLTFKMQKPVEYAELKMMFRMQYMVQLCAAWMVDGNVKVGTLKALMKSLENMLSEEDFSPTLALGICRSIRSIVSSPDQSPIGFLMNLPEIDLNRALMPAIDFSSEACCVEEYLTNFAQEPQQQAHQDRLALDAGSTAPLEVN